MSRPEGAKSTAMGWNDEGGGGVVRKLKVLDKRGDRRASIPTNPRLKRFQPWVGTEILDGSNPHYTDPIQLQQRGLGRWV